MNNEFFPYWFPLVFVTGWLFVCALLAELSQWPKLARAWPPPRR